MAVRIYRGDTPTLEFTITDEDGNPVDLTGCTLYFAVKMDDEVIINREALIIDPTKGLAQITLTAEETDHVGAALGELEGRYSDGTITTFGQFIIEFLEDVRK